MVCHKHIYSARSIVHPFKKSVYAILFNQSLSIRHLVCFSQIKNKLRLSKERHNSEDYCKGIKGLCHRGGDYCNKENIVTMRSASVSRVRQKGLFFSFCFFSREGWTRLGRTESGEMGWEYDWIVGNRLFSSEAGLFGGRSMQWLILCYFHWATGCRAIWSNNVLSISIRIFLDEIVTLSNTVSKADYST